MSGHPFVQVDAFTRESVGGNPAAVFLLAAARDEGWMQREFDLCWFTPTVEVELCGHGARRSTSWRSRC